MVLFRVLNNVVRLDGPVSLEVTLASLAWLMGWVSRDLERGQVEREQNGQSNQETT